MNGAIHAGACAALAACLWTSAAGAEILAMVNYETKSPESLKAMKSPTSPQERREGLAILDVDPDSPNYGKIVEDIELPPDLVAHHLFYNRDMSKLYLTALGKSVLHVIDIDQRPITLKAVETPECSVQEDIIFSADNSRWWITCMGSDTVVEGNAKDDTVVRNISTPEPYPHGIAIHDDIDRILISSTVRAEDLGDPGDKITAIKASTGETLESYKVSNKESPAGEAPVEILFVPGATPPVAFVTNMYGGSVWSARWNEATEKFEVAEVHAFDSNAHGVPLEMYFNDDASRFYVTTAKPGAVHIFDISQDPAQPELLKTLPAAEGAHHVAFTNDWKLAYVQNALLNLPGMSDGSITVVDLEKEQVIGSIDTLKEMGYNPNSIVLLPEWNHLAGH